MDFLYRLLGAAASVAYSASRGRTVHIPHSVIPLMGWLVLPMLMLGGLLQQWEGTDPKPVSVDEIVRAKEAPPHGYVTLTGRYHPDFSLHGVPQSSKDTSTRDEPTEKTYVAFIDPKVHAAVMVQMSPGEALGLSTQPTTLTGMLRYAEPPLREKLPPKLVGLPLSHHQYLEVGAVPSNLRAVGVIAGVLMLPLGIYTMALLLGSVIFRRQQRVAAGSSAPAAAGEFQQVADVRASGPFYLHAGMGERFVQVPASVVELDDGGLGVYANVDASISQTLYFFTISKEKRVGYWLLWVGHRTVRNVELGMQYLGLGRRPAIRCRFQSPNGVRSTLVLSFDTEESRSVVLAELLRRAAG